MCRSIKTHPKKNVQDLAQNNTPTAYLQRGKTPTNECPGYDTKQSYGEVSVMLELWGM